MQEFKDMVEKVDIKTVIPNENNPRILKDDKFKKLVKSIKEFPQMLEIRPIVVNADNIVLGGNMRLEACKKAGLKEVTILKAEHLTKEQQDEFIIKDNVGFGEWNWDMIANEWDVEQVEEWGLDVPEWDNGEELEAEEDEFDVPDGGIETDIVVGDLFEIGEHRLLCGDSTDSDAVAKLMNGEKADMVFTDPPYNISFKPPRGTHEEILNDDMSDEDFKQFLSDVFSMCDFAMKDNTVLISFMGWSTVAEFQQVLREIFTIKSMPIWVKNNFGIGYFTRPKHEPSFLCLKGNPEKPQTAPADVFECAKVYKTIHSCEKPILLIEEMIKPFSKINDLFFEPFGGSGSTMVATHQLKRKCYTMELDPKYCQVIVDRMMKLDPTLEVKRNGVKYERLETVE